MFIRKKTNKSGSVSVQIISKESGRYRVFQTLGSSNDPDEIERLAYEARATLARPPGQLKLLSTKSPDALAVKTFVQKLSNAQVHTMGPELIFGALFDRLGFNAIPHELFRHITIARLAYPASKLKTIDYLKRYKGVNIHKHAVYRFLDTLQSKYKETVEGIAYEHTKQTLKTISVIFYDMTTLYFEAEDEDDLRKIGFSKDGKFQNPQIMLGLLVGEHGYPIGYDIFQGNTFEGHTLLPILKNIQKKYGFAKPVVVADAALLSKDNIKNLAEQKYQFIVGGRIKNEAAEVKREILKRVTDMKDGDHFIIEKGGGLRLVVTYSEKRARKDARNRERGLKKLRARVASGRLTKKMINNRGYNKFLTLKGAVNVSIDEGRAEADGQWDGLKGYVTNTRLSADTVVEHYGHLWQIEQAFRISKTDLRIRPVYHYRRRRIEAHICVAFVAYAIYKELERLLKKQGIGMSVKRAAELTHNMYELEYVLPGEILSTKTLFQMDDEQQLLYNAIHG